MPRELSRGECNFIALFSAIEGAVFGWAAAALPWQSFTVFSLLGAGLAATKAVTVLCALFQPAHAASAWRSSALVALAQLGWVTWTVFTGGAYIAGLYGSLGKGLFAALLAIWGLCVLLTLPTAVWALMRTRGAWPRLGKRPVQAAAVLLGLFVIRAGLLSHTGTGDAVAQAREPTTLIGELEGIARDITRSGRVTPPPFAIKAPASVSCPESPRRAGVTLVATYPANKGKTFVSDCIQADQLDVAALSLRERLDGQAARFPVRVDLVRRTSSVGHGPDWIRTFELRPGLDGVCLDTECWTAWQLLVRDAFLENQPLSFVKDLRFGASQTHLRQLLLAAITGTATHAPDVERSHEELLRIETLSWVINEAGVHSEHRMRPMSEAISEGLVQDRRALESALQPSPAQVKAAMAAAERHILEAQLDDGRFRYMLHPFTGKKQIKNFNLPRQAGTAYVLCELGSDLPHVQKAIGDALSLLAKHEKRDAAGAVAGLSLNPKARSVGLEDSALPLVAFLQCRERTGSRFDETIQKLSRLVLALQREDGSLAPSFDLDKNARRAGAEPLFGPGQASLALVLLERQIRAGTLSAFVDPDAVRAARRRLTTHVTKQHWPPELYPLFFVEENWHCLSARAAVEIGGETK
jgi:hypothetical protein